MSFLIFFIFFYHGNFDKGCHITRTTKKYFNDSLNLKETKS